MPNVLVTFLWRQQRPGDVRLLWPTPEVNTRRFEALAGSDVRYLSLPLRRDARVSYQLSADLPDLQQADRGTLRLALQAAAGPAEPYAVAQQPRAAAGRAGLAGAARRRPCRDLGPAAQGRAARQVERLGYSSQALANQRQLTLYTPPGYDPEGQRYPLLVLFDEDHYARDVPTPTILDNLIAAGRIRPTLAVIVGNVDASSRGRELPCNEAFADMLAHELLPWLQQRYALSEEPADRVLSGSSYGGLASGCIAYRYPERFGKVLSLSGSFWWGRTSSSRSGWYGSSPLASVCRWRSSSVPACSRSPRRTAFSAATATCARRCKARATRCTTVSSPAVTTTRRGAWSLPKGCRPCCRRIEPAGWRGADSRLPLSAVPRPGGGEGCPERVRNAHRVAESEKSSRAICQRRRIGDNRRSPQSNDKDVLDAPTLAPGILRRALLPVPSAGPGCRRKRNPRPVPALAGRPRATQRQGPGRGLCAAPGLLWPRADARAHPLRQAGFFARHPDFEQRIVAAPQIVPGDQEGRYEVRASSAGTPRRTPAQLSGAAPGRARRAWRYLALRRRERRDHPLRRRPAVHPAGSRPLRRYRGGLRLGSGPRAEQRRLVRRIRGLPLRPLERRRASRLPLGSCTGAVLSVPGGLDDSGRERLQLLRTWWTSTWTKSSLLEIRDGQWVRVLPDISTTWDDAEAELVLYKADPQQPGRVLVTETAMDDEGDWSHRTRSELRPVP